MNERIRFIDHQGKRILLVNLSKCPVNQVEEIVRRVPDYITVESIGSVLVLTDFTAATFDRDTIVSPPHFMEELKSFSRRDMTIFKTRDAALAWLTADSGDA
jgi:hypothetical protein